jgi:hypothetical protein
MKWISHELLMKEQAAERWRLLSVFCLIIYGKTLSPIEVPRERTDRFVRIGQELEILELDYLEKKKITILIQFKLKASQCGSFLFFFFLL